MSGPKHLWSGDWEGESVRAAENRAAQPPLDLSEPEPPQAPEQEPSPRRRMSLRYAVVAGVLVVAVAAVLAATLPGSSKPKHHPRNASTIAQAPAPTTSTGPSGGVPLQSTHTVGNGPSATWLGMQLVSAPGGVTIDSVQLGSAADAAGFEPGDVIEEVDNQQVHSISQIAAITNKVQLGRLVNIQVLRSSVMVMLSSIPMKERPTIKP
jgi:membrane-associated protease RseP (regulator of RpoE activity)